MSLVIYIIAFGLVPASSHYYEENTCRQQSMFYQEAPGVNISLLEIFQRYILVTANKKYDESAVMEIS